MLQLVLSQSIAGIEPISKEVEQGTDAVISCIITGITEQLDQTAIEWYKDGADVTTLPGFNYLIEDSELELNSQTTSLTVRGVVNTADATYTCVITSSEWQEIRKETAVSLQVFCKWHFLIL